ncbi:MAG: ATPase domain-containing protein [Nevskia sp.]
MNRSKADIRRFATGVPGLDEILGGGLPEFSFNILAGPPGCGKTTLAHQIMFAQATVQRPALYFTVLGEPPLKILRYQQQFDFFDIEKVGRAIHYVNLTDDDACGDLDQILARITAEVETHSPGLIFIDSYCAMTFASAGGARSVNGLQNFIQNLGRLSVVWSATTFLIGEYLDETDANPAFTVADGLIWMRQSTQRNSVVRKMELSKMRGQPTRPGLHTFRITTAGIAVFAPLPLRPRTQGATASPQESRLTMGVPGLDEMMGGGLPRGYSLLVAGPSGSGKSILSSAFLVEGARLGETGVIAAFEQRPSHARGPLVAGLIDSGQVGVVDTRAPDLSVDEMAMLLVAEIRRLKATRVVIDSLSGFELSLAPTFRDDFRESVARMMSALAGTGVTVLMTSELEDRYTDLRFSPYGTAFLTDAIIVQRYIEVDSRLERLMAVVKVRGSAHSNQLRLFHIDADGIQMGHMLSDREGLLGGKPTRRHPAPAAMGEPGHG